MKKTKNKSIVRESGLSSIQLRTSVKQRLRALKRGTYEETIIFLLNDMKK